MFEKHGQPSKYWRNIYDKNDSQISELLIIGVPSNNDASNTWFWMLPFNTYWLL